MQDCISNAAGEQPWGAFVQCYVSSGRYPLRNTAGATGKSTSLQCFQTSKKKLHMNEKRCL